MNITEMTTPSYKICHTMLEPSKMSDYDYDPSKPWRRFITTYVHHLDIFDKITDMQVLRLNFGSDTCASMIAALLNASIYYGKPRSAVGTTLMGEEIIEGPRPRKGALSTIKNIFVDNSPYPSMMTITVLGSNVQLALLNYSQDIYITLTQEESGKLADMLDSDELNEMYMVPSDDSWYPIVYD